MMALNIGDIRTESLNIQVGGVDTDPTTLTLYVRKPGVAYTTSIYNQGGQTYTIVKDSVGDYHVDITIDTAGIWHGEWVSTGPGAGSEEFRFRVREQKTRGA